MYSEMNVLVFKLLGIVARKIPNLFIQWKCKISIFTKQIHFKYLVQSSTD